MTKTTVYGIRNCETMKKAFRWLEEHGIDYAFHDYKKEGADKDLLRRAIDENGWENALNRKGTTWRALPDAVKDGMTDKRALAAAAGNPSVIRRPIVTRGAKMLVGFDEAAFANFFGKN